MDNADIIRAIKAGDKEVIKDVYKDNAKDVYNFAKSITGDHDSAMNATKRTFVNLFTNIQKGDEPANIRLAALKLAYDEACRIAMPSTENIDSPFDRHEESGEEASAPLGSEVPQTDSDAEQIPAYEAPAGAVVGDGIIDTPEEMNEVMDEEGFEDDGASEEPEIPEAEVITRRHRAYDGSDDIGTTQVFSIKEALGEESGEIEMDEEYDDEEDEYDEFDDEDEEYESAPRSKTATVIIVIINIILALILIWLLYGLLVSFGVIPDVVHLGFTYTFFNEHIYPIF